MILAILGVGYGFSALVLNWVCFFEEATFSFLSIRPSIKAFHKLHVEATVPAVISRESSFFVRP